MSHRVRAPVGPPTHTTSEADRRSTPAAGQRGTRSPCPTRCFSQSHMGTMVCAGDNVVSGRLGGSARKEPPMVLPPEAAGQSAAAADDERSRNRQTRLAAVASVVGTSIEWYDFFLYGTAAAIVFPSVFFPKSSAYAGTLESFGTYAVGFAARPVGAAIFGHWGDRIGRKATLIVTLLLMGLASALIGVMPTYGSIGFWAPTILVLLRIVQGLGVGGG